MAEHVFYCGLDPPTKLPRHFQQLLAHGSNPNITLDRMPLSRRLLANVPDRMLDLIDLATYVLAADRRVSRGGLIGDNMGADWRRRFRLRIAVRDPGFWSQPAIVNTLVEMLAFLSEDDFAFEFDKCHDPPLSDAYFPTLHDSGPPIQHPVLLFSGGLDSLSGAVEEIEQRADRVVLVTHHSSDYVKSFQTGLTRELSSRLPGRVLSIPVSMNFTGGFAERASTQRTRSFFFAAIASVAGALLGAPGIRFYENGILSLNLPISAQVVGTSATRSTHPRVLADLAALLQVALDRPVSVDNPFHLKTKAEVVQLIGRRGYADLIDLSFTCSKVRHRESGYTHCGICIQCLHRRFGVMEAGIEAHDDPSKYAFQIFEGVAEDEDKTMLVEFVQSARRWSTMSDEAFELEHGLEFSRIPAAHRSAGLKREFFDLYRRHGAQVTRVLELGLERHKGQLAKGTMPPGSLLTFVVGDQLGPDYQDSNAERPQPEVAPAIHLMIDPERGVYSVADRPPRKGPAAIAFLSILAKAHAADTASGRKPEDFAFSSTAQLETALGKEATTIAKLVEKIREKIRSDLIKAGREVADLDDVIQSVRGKGYRLNPQVRLIAPPGVTIEGS